MRLTPLEWGLRAPITPRLGGNRWALPRLGKSELNEEKRLDHFETIRVAKNGRKLSLSVTVSPIKDSAGHVVGACKVARDITERKKAEEALRKASEEADEVSLRR